MQGFCRWLSCYLKTALSVSSLKGSAAVPSTFTAMVPCGTDLSTCVCVCVCAHVCAVRESCDIPKTARVCMVLWIMCVCVCVCVWVHHMAVNTADHSSFTAVATVTVHACRSHEKTPLAPPPAPLSTTTPGTLHLGLTSVPIATTSMGGWGQVTKSKHVRQKMETTYTGPDLYPCIHSCPLSFLSTPTLIISSSLSITSNYNYLI